MKRGLKKLLIFEIITMILIFLNSFVSSILGKYADVILLVILLIAFYFFFGFERDRHHLWKNISLEIIIFLLIFFILYYLMGIIVSFTKTNNYYSIYGFLLVLLPMILSIVLREIFRYMLLSKTANNKVLLMLTIIVFVLIDLVGKYSFSMNSEKFTIFVFIAVRLLPSISKNVLCSYIAINVGYRPSILYLLITELYGYLIPIVPNPNQYFYAVIWLIIPFILMYRLYLYLKKEKHDFVIERKYNKKKIYRLFFPLTIVIFMVYLVSGYFHYHAIVVASGSMIKEINKGDVVIIEKIDGDIDLLDINDVIAYRLEGRIIVHRLVKRITINGEPYFYTKGDANNSVDNYKITKDMIIGKLKYKIPYIGYPTVWINNL